jgi:predicted nucleic acid-binding protein
VIVVADTSGIIAASDRNARESAACRQIFQQAGAVIIPPLVLTEVDRLAKARFGSRARTTIIEFVIAQARQLRFQIPETDLEILDTARQVQRQYAGLDLNLADAVNVGLAAQYGTDAVLTRTCGSPARTSQPAIPTAPSRSEPSLSSDGARALSERRPGRAPAVRGQPLRAPPPAPAHSLPGVPLLYASRMSARSDW